MSKHPIPGDRDKAFFVGYDRMAPVDRRTMLGFSALGLAAGGGIAWLLARKQNPVFGGVWAAGETVELSGYVAPDPYPVLHTRDLGGGWRTVILGTQGKCGAQSRLAEAALTDARAVVRGSLLQREIGDEPWRRHVMMATDPGADWITPFEGADLPRRLEPFGEEDLGSAELAGEILDPKCWFGAMAPNEGLNHKACAALCIAGGYPPYFYAVDRRGRDIAMMITDPQGGPLIAEILPFVAEPVRLSGRLVRIADLVQFRVDPNTVARLTA